jgi:hypothetical protein
MEIVYDSSCLYFVDTVAPNFIHILKTGFYVLIQAPLVVGFERERMEFVNRSSFL